MRRLRRTKIVATLGPASSDRSVIASLFQAGADVFRINMSHTSHDRMRELVATIRDIESEHGRPIGILVDLQGPSCGSAASRPVRPRSPMARSSPSMPIPRPATPSACTCRTPRSSPPSSPATRCLLDDGKMRLVATEVDNKRIVTRVEVGGNLSDRKGVSLPDTTMPFSALAEKDRSDLEAALDAGIDWVALSFIQRPEDIAEAKKITRGRAAVMAKIEKPQAVHRLGEILDLADALMVARGDLGVEMPLEKVPGVQKQMTRIGAARRQAGRGRDPDARIHDLEPGPDPRRGVRRFDCDLRGRGCDHAVGGIGGRAISGRGGRHHEPHRRGGRKRPALSHHHPRPTHRAGGDRRRCDRRGGAPDRRDARLSAIICWTFSGSTALRVARERPQSPIVAISPRLSTGRRLSLVWGVHCIVAEDAHDLDDMVERACRLACKDGFAKPGQRVIVVAGVPLGTPGATNMLRIAFVGAEAAKERSRRTRHRRTARSSADAVLRRCLRSLARRSSRSSFLTRSGIRSRRDG